VTHSTPIRGHQTSDGPRLSLPSHTASEIGVVHSAHIISHQTANIAIASYLAVRQAKILDDSFTNATEKPHTIFLGADDK
jgi:hypothetical protein